MYDFGPDPDVYIYDCSICKKEVRTIHPEICIICKKKVCVDHLVEGFCSHHYDEISAMGKLTLKEESKPINDHKSNVTKWEIGLGIGLSVPTIIISLIVAFIHLIFIIPVLIFGVIIIGAILSPLENIKKKCDEKLVSKKREIYHQHRKKVEPKEDSSTLTLTKKECKNCRMKLRAIAKYCDYCGEKL